MEVRQLAAAAKSSNGKPPSIPGGIHDQVSLDRTLQRRALQLPEKGGAPQAGRVDGEPTELGSADVDESRPWPRRVAEVRKEGAPEVDQLGAALAAR